MRKPLRPECSRIGSFKIWTKEKEGSPKEADGRRSEEWVPVEEGLGAQQGRRGHRKVCGWLTLRLNQRLKNQDK